MTEHMRDELRLLAERVLASNNGLTIAERESERAEIAAELRQLADRPQSEASDNMREIIAAAELRGYRRAEAEVAERADHSEDVLSMVVTDTEIEAWATRHGFDGWSRTDRRCAFEDAQTWAQKYASPTTGDAKPCE
jgi:hypothetical protein